MMFLLIGEQRPEVHYLDSARLARFWERLGIADGSAKARTETYRLTFGVSGARYAMPFTVETMEHIALEARAQDIGPHEEEVRAFAAALALGKPMVESGNHRTRMILCIDNDGTNGSGGSRSPLVPLPKQPSPVPAMYAETVQ